MLDTGVASGPPIVVERLGRSGEDSGLAAFLQADPTGTAAAGPSGRVQPGQSRSSRRTRRPAPRTERDSGSQAETLSRASLASCASRVSRGSRRSIATSMVSAHSQASKGALTRRMHQQRARSLAARRRMELSRQEEAKMKKRRNL